MKLVRGSRAPQVSSDAGTLVPAYAVLIVQLLVGMCAACVATLTIFPPAVPVAILLMSLAAFSVVRQYSPLVVHVSIGFALLAAFQQAELSPVMFALAVLVVVLLRSHTLMQFAKNTHLFEIDVIKAELKRIGAISVVVCAVGLVSANVGSLGSGWFSLVAVVVAVLGLLFLVLSTQGHIAEKLRARNNR